MRIARLAVACLGILCTISGRFFDRALEIDSFAANVAPEYFYTKSALEAMAADERLGIDSRHPAFDVFVMRWPKLPNRSNVRYIRRTQAYMEFGVQVRAGIALVALDLNKNEIDKTWTFAEVTRDLHAPFEQSWEADG